MRVILPDVSEEVFVDAFVSSAGFDPRVLRSPENLAFGLLVLELLLELLDLFLDVRLELDGTLVERLFRWLRFEYVTYYDHFLEVVGVLLLNFLYFFFSPHLIF